MVGQESRTHNSTFAIGGVSCSADSFVVAESFVLRINISGKNPAHRKSAKRFMRQLMMTRNLTILTSRQLKFRVQRNNSKKY